MQTIQLTFNGLMLSQQDRKVVWVVVKPFHSSFRMGENIINIGLRVLVSVQDRGITDIDN